MREGLASRVSGTASLVRSIIQRPRVHYDDTAWLRAAQVVELCIGAYTVAMMCHEPSAVREALHDRRDRRPLRWRHPVSGTGEPDLGQLLAADRHLNQASTILISPEHEPDTTGTLGDAISHAFQEADDDTRPRDEVKRELAE